MNRKHRRSLILLPLSLGVVGLFAGREMASWRPVAVGKMLGGSSVASCQVLLSATNRFVLGEPNGNYTATLFDLKTATRKKINGDEFRLSGERLWELDDESLTSHEQSGTTKSYALPLLSAEEADDLDLGQIHVHPALNRVELLCLNRYSRWNQTSGRLERTTKLGLNGDQIALSQDGEKIIKADWDNVSYISTRTGKLIRRFSLSSLHLLPRNQRLSHFGSYALYDDVEAPSSNCPVMWNVIDTKNGSIKWHFALEEYSDDVILSSDELLIALPIPSRQVWQIRELANGKVLRELPRLRNTQGSTFSPDSATLYSVSNGTLYRQRAR